MTVEPHLQILLFAAIFLLGVFLGILSEAGRALYVLFGISAPPPLLQKYYEKRLPWLPRPLKREGVYWGRRAAFFLEGLVVFCFCLLSGLFFVLLIYRYADGAFRFILPFLLLFGIWISRALLGPFLSLPLGVFSLFFAVFFKTLIAAACFMFGYIKKFFLFVLHKAGKFVKIKKEKQKEKRSKRHGREKTKKKKLRRAHGHSDFNCADISCRNRDYRQSPCRVQSKKARDRKNAGSDRRSRVKKS